MNEKIDHESRCIQYIHPIEDCRGFFAASHVHKIPKNVISPPQKNWGDKEKSSSVDGDIWRLTLQFLDGDLQVWLNFLWVRVLLHPAITSKITTCLGSGIPKKTFIYATGRGKNIPDEDENGGETNVLLLHWSCKFSYCTVLQGCFWGGGSNIRLDDGHV